MPEAAIVSAARSPIGRANKGSLKDFRPDDLSALIIKAAAGQDPRAGDDRRPHPRLRPPGGEAGNNMGQGGISALLGYEIPGTTITRYCSSCVQTSRMAFHAIEAGEGDAFISAGVRSPASPKSDHPGTRNPLLRRGQRPHRGTPRGVRTGTTARGAGGLPDIYIAMGQTADVARNTSADRKELDEFAVRSQNLAEKAINDGFWANEITPVRHPTARSARVRRRPRAGVTYEAISRPQARVRPDGVVTAQGARLNDGAAAVIVMSGAEGEGARTHPLAEGRVHRRRDPPASPRDHGPRPRRGDEAGAGAREHVRRRHRPRRERGVRRRVVPSSTSA